MDRKKQVLACVLAMLLSVSMICAQELINEAEEDPDVATELVVEDFGTTGLGDHSSFGVAVGGLLEGSAMLDISIDFFVNPLIGIRVSTDIVLPIAAAQAGNVDFAIDLGIGAVWRSYVVNRVRFYGGLVIRLGIAPLSDLDLLLIPEGFGGFEFYASPKAAIYAEFGGRTAIPVISLNGGTTNPVYAYADGFFFKIGTRFGL